MDQTIAIAGSGIAGLAAALATAQAGYRTVIFGQPPKKQQGGVQLAPNAWQALNALGLSTSVLDRSTRLSDIAVRNLETAATITRLPLSDTYASISRAALFDSLMTAVMAQPNVELVPEPLTSINQAPIDQSSRNSSISNNPGPVIGLVTETAILHHADALIGADGQFGLARRYVSSRDAAFVSQTSGKVALRLQAPAASLPASFSHPSSNLWLGRGVHVVHYPIGDQINIVVTLPRHKAAKGWQERVFAADTPLAILASAHFIWHSQPLPSASSGTCWRRGNVVLAGDAAHIMPPHLAQGAGQGLQDAASILHHLGLQTGLHDALSGYARARSTAVAKIAAKAEISGMVMGLDGPAARLRNIILDVGGNSLLRGWLTEVWAGDPKLAAKE